MINIFKQVNFQTVLSLKIVNIFTNDLQFSSYKKKNCAKLSETDNLQCT